MRFQRRSAALFHPRLALSALLLALAPACASSPDDDAPHDDETVATTAALVAPGRAPEINFRHKTCSLTSVATTFTAPSRPASSQGSASFKYRLACEDGTAPTVTRTRTMPVSTAGVAYDFARFEIVTRICTSWGGRNGLQCQASRETRAADDQLAGLNEGVDQVVWDTAQTALAAIASHGPYDRQRMTLQVYDERPAFPFENGRDVAPDDFPHVTARVRWNADPRYVADVYVLPSTRGGGFLDSPLIVGDAFDPGNDRRLPQIYTNAAYRKLLSTRPEDRGPRTGANARDVVYVDFAQGGGDLFVNAQLLLRVTEWVQERARQEVIVGGVSMGGVLGRMALLYSLPANNVGREDLARRVRGFLSVDAPHLGASLAPRLQQVSCAFSEHRWLPDSEGTNPAVGSWKDLRSPGARLMLAGMYERADGDTRCGVSNTRTDVHAAFMARLAQMATTAFGAKKRGFRGDIPSVGIAYSNFYRPHGGLDPTVARRVGKIDPPVADRRYLDLGGASDPSRLEFYPGSTGDWYWEPLKRRSPKYVTADVLQGEVWKGTFLPIHSALALAPSFDPLNPPTLDERQMARHSAFDAVYYMKDPTNRYECEIHGRCGHVPTPDDRRYQHMVFDDQLLAAVQQGLADLLAMPRRMPARSRSYNGDTAADLAFFEPAENAFHVSLSRAGGFGAPGSGRWVTTGTYGRLADQYIAGDFTGDGTLDMGYLGPDNAIQVLWGNGRSFGGPGSGVWMGANGFGHPAGRHFAGDFDGDGRDDLAFFEPGDRTTHVSLSTGRSFGAAGSGRWIGSDGFGSNRDRFFVGDFDGDGRSDLGYDGEDASFHVTTSTGAGFGGPGSGRWIAPGALGGGLRYYIGDYDGDGRDDLGYFRGGDRTFQVALSTGAGFGAPRAWVRTDGFGNVADRYYPADYDGDGRCDLGYQETGDNSFHVTLSTGSDFGAAGSGRWIGPNEFGHSGGRYYVSRAARR